MAAPVACTTAPLAGLYQATQMARMYYGAGAVRRHLAGCLAEGQSRAFVVTGQTLATKTPVIKAVEAALGAAHAGTFARISAHAQVDEIDAATAELEGLDGVDTLVSVGGGSPIDAAKVLASRTHERTGRYLRHVAVPTTLSVAEATMMAGYTDKSGLKTGVRGPELVPWAVVYDADFVANHTPPHLAMTTALRALDHAVELLYNPHAAEAPTKALCLQAIADLFEYLPRYRQTPTDTDVVTKLQLASFNSLSGLGLNLGGPLGLSHTLGYAIGSPYGVPHGVTSCITLAPVVRLKAETDPEAAAQIARALPFAVPGTKRTGDDRADAKRVADAIADLVSRLGIATTLTEQKVGRDQVAIIAERATRQKEGKQFDAIKTLVEGLY